MHRVDKRQLREKLIHWKNVCTITNVCSDSFSQATISASLETRDHVINELLVTEQNFVVVLNALRYKFMQPMEKCLKGDTAIIFPRIKVSRRHEN